MRLIDLKNSIILILNRFFKKIKSNKKLIEDKGQTSAEMILLLGGMMIIVLLAIYFYKDYLLGIGEEMNSTEIAKVNNSIKNISSKFD